MEEIVIVCKQCGKAIIRRQPNGIWHFVFGRQVGGNRPAVDMLVHGNIKLKCWRSECGYTNTLNFLPKKEGE